MWCGFWFDSACDASGYKSRSFVKYDGFVIIECSLGKTSSAPPSPPLRPLVWGLEQQGRLYGVFAVLSKQPPISRLLRCFMSCFPFQAASNSAALHA